MEPPDKNYQYLLFACEPYETIGFKVPTDAVDKGEARFFTNWDGAGRKFTLSLQFADEDLRKAQGPPGAGGKHRADLRYDMKY